MQAHLRTCASSGLPRSSPSMCSPRILQLRSWRHGGGPIAVNDEGRESFVLEDRPTRTRVAYDGVLGATLGVGGRDREDSSARGRGVRRPVPEAGGLDGRRGMKHRCSLSVWARFSPNDLVFHLQFAGADRLVDHLTDLLVEPVLRSDAYVVPSSTGGTASSPIAPLTAYDSRLMLT